MVKEMDGVRLPITVKEVFCSPPSSIPLVLDYATITETLGDKDERQILSQFISDANSFEGALSAQRIIKYENSMVYDPETSLNNYEVKVTFITVSGFKILYDYKIK